MSELIGDVGHFRGEVLAGAIATTTNGFPQLVLEVHATDVYDEDNGEWFEDAIDGVLTGYFCLFGGNGKATLAVRQVIEVTGWDGASFKGLNDLVQKLVEEGLPIGFTTKENTYEGNTSIQVDWIRPFDAVPTRGVQACSPEELKALDQQYAKSLQVTKGKAKIAAPKPTTKPKPPTRPALQKGEVTGAQTATEAEVTEATPPPEQMVKPKPKPVVTGKSSKGKAWIKITKANKAEATDKGGGGVGFDDTQLAELWQNTCESVAGNVSPNEITTQQWYQIQEECVAQLMIPF